MNGLLLALAVIAGTMLRVYGLRGQLLVSDEWHALHAAARLPLSELAVLTTLGATSIPQNLYTRLLLAGPGWSETALRLPSLLAGVASLLLFPLLVRDVLKPRATIVFAYLLALSPFLVFYARYCRPYSLVVLLTFLSLIACYRWAVSGRIRAAAVFASTGAMAGYVHVPEMRSIVLPLLLLLVVKWRTSSEPNGGPIRPTFTALVLAGLVPMAVLALVLLPAFLDAGQNLTTLAARGHPGAATLVGVTEFLAGTADPVARGAFVTFAALGFALLFRRDGLLASLCLVVTGGSAAMVLLARPALSELPIIFARYVIAAFPVVLLAVAVGIDGVQTWVEERSSFPRRSTRLALNATAAAGLAALVVLGPLPRLYAGRNDFMNHKAFQASYGGLDAAGRYARAVRHLLDDAGRPLVNRFPPFYLQLARDDGCGTVIEYPLPIGDMSSPYFLYQTFHQKRVLGGYLYRRDPGAGLGPGMVAANQLVDEVLGEVGEPAKLRFRNLVNLGDAAAVRDSGACYLIVHTDLDAELGGAPDASRPTPAAVPDLVDRFGRPVFEDAWTTVFDLRGRQG